MKDSVRLATSRQLSDERWRHHAITPTRVSGSGNDELDIAIRARGYLDALISRD